MILKIKTAERSIEFDSDVQYQITDKPGEEEISLRKVLGLPIKKPIVYYKIKTNSDSAIFVTSIRITEMYEITDRWFTLEITLENAETLKIHSSFLADMQKPDFTISKDQ